MSFFSRTISLIRRRSESGANGAKNGYAPPSAGCTISHGFLEPWIPDLGRMNAELVDFSQKTEDEFLEVGKCLQGFSEACAANSAMSQEIAGMIEGGKGFDLGAFQELFRSAFKHTGACADAISEGLKDIAGMKASLADVTDLQAFLKGLSKSINTIGILSRIETARIEGAEFGSMTSVVDDLARQIVKSAEEITLSAADANASISLIGLEMRKKLDHFKKKLNAAREHVDAIINEMNTVKTRATWTCGRIEERSSEIIPGLGEIVSLLQYHDICRQKAEHAAEALTDIVGRIGCMNAMGGEEKLAAMQWASNVLRIQISQLESVIAETAKAAEGVSGQFTRISGLAEVQADDARTIVKEEESGSTRIEKIVDELENLLSITSECRNMTEEMIRAVSEVSEKINRMSVHTSNIVMISENINLLAMNAIIKVSHTGDSGRALGVLANKISGLSKVATEQITKGSAKIKEILEKTTGFRDALSGVLNEQLVGADGVVRRTHAAVEELLEADKALMKSMSGVSTTLDELKNDISKLMSGIRFDRTTNLVVGGVISALKKMMEMIAANLPGVSDDGRDTASSALAELAGRYTMESEREVHNAVLAGAGVAEKGPFGRASGPAADDLGANVELF